MIQRALFPVSARSVVGMAGPSVCERTRFFRAIHVVRVPLGIPTSSNLRDRHKIRHWVVRLVNLNARDSVNRAHERSHMEYGMSEG